MLVQIRIDCEDERELLLHLTVIRQQVKAHFKKIGDGDFKQFEVKDNNCYGTHKCVVKS